MILPFSLGITSALAEKEPDAGTQAACDGGPAFCSDQQPSARQINAPTCKRATFSYNLLPYYIFLLPYLWRKLWESYVLGKLWEIKPFFVSSSSMMLPWSHLCYKTSITIAISLLWNSLSGSTELKFPLYLTASYLKQSVCNCRNKPPISIPSPGKAFC